MQYSIALVASMALAMANAVSFTNSAFNGITAGQSVTLTWTDASGPVTITLKNGASNNLNTVSTIASGQTSGSFTWNVPSTLTQDTYAFEITDSSGKPNYSPQFQLIGGAAATGTTSAVASSSSAASSSASFSASSLVSSAVSSVSSVLSSQSAAASSSISSVVSSVSSVVDSITSNSTTTATPSSSTGVSNATTTTSGSSSSTKASSTGSKTSSAATGTSTATTVPNANSAVQMASPLALVFLTFAAIFSFN